MAKKAIAVVMGKKELAGALTWLSGMVRGSTHTPILSTVQLTIDRDGLFLTLTDLELAGVVQLPIISGAVEPARAITVCIPYKEFLRVVRSVPGETVSVTLSPDRGNAQFTSGDKGMKSKYRGRLQCVEGGGSYPEIPGGVGIIPSPEQNPAGVGESHRLPYGVLRDALGAVSSCVPPQEQGTRYTVAGTLLCFGGGHALAPAVDHNNVLAAATDGHRMLLCSRGWEGEPGNAETEPSPSPLVPLGFTQGLGTMAGHLGVDTTTPVILRVKENYLHLWVGDGGGDGKPLPRARLVGRRIAGSFPDYTRVLDAHHPDRILEGHALGKLGVEFSGRVEDWLAVVTRSRAMAREDKRVIVHLAPWDLGAEQGDEGPPPGSWISAQQDNGEVQEALPGNVLGLGSGEYVEFGVNVRYLQGALQALGGLGAEEFRGWCQADKATRLVGSAVSMYGAGLWVIIMPMR